MATEIVMQFKCGNGVTSFRVYDVLHSQYYTSTNARVLEFKSTNPGAYTSFRIDAGSIQSGYNALPADEVSITRSINGSISYPGHPNNAMTFIFQPVVTIITLDRVNPPEPSNGLYISFGEGIHSVTVTYYTSPTSVASMTYYSDTVFSSYYPNSSIYITDVTTISGYGNVEVYANGNYAGYFNSSNVPYINAADLPFIFSFKASRTVPLYSVIFMDNDGTNNYYEINPGYGEEIGFAYTPIRDGYELLGWNENKNASTANYNIDSTYTVVGDVTFYAIWKELDAEYTIEYEPNNTGVQNMPIRQIKQYGVTLILSDKVPTCEHYTFLGWAISPVGEVKYQPGDNYTENVSRTLWAIWEPEKFLCKLYFENDSDDGLLYYYQRPDVPYNGTFTFPSVGNPPKRSNYLFLGWAESRTPASDARYYDPSSTSPIITEATNFYAIYAPIPFNWANTVAPGSSIAAAITADKWNEMQRIIHAIDNSFMLWNSYSENRLWHVQSGDSLTISRFNTVRNGINALSNSGNVVPERTSADKTIYATLFDGVHSENGTSYNSLRTALNFAIITYNSG